MKLIFIFLSFLSCSNFSEKNAYVDELVFKNGRLGDMTWNEELSFKRVTFFSKANMEFDLYLGEVTKDSKFTSWFEGGEKKFLNQCNQLFISISSSNFSRVIKDGMYMSTMRNQGMKEVIATDFLHHLKSHPDFRKWNLIRYKTRLMCTESSKAEVAFTFPSFQTIKLGL